MKHRAARDRLAAERWVQRAGLSAPAARATYGRWTGRAVFGAVVLAICGSACGGGALSRQEGGRPRVEPRDTRIVHEDCAVNDSDAQREDVNGDGRPDRLTVGGNRPSCVALDFNFDGAMDTWIYYDGSGGERRRESDYDRDGRIDEVSLYRGGQLAERQRATTLMGKLDTWHYYAEGKVARTERDSNGDDYIDQWWEYPSQRTQDCPLIHSDVDGDGQPDPGATVDVCREQYVPAARDGARPEERSNEGIGDVPTELPVEQEADAPAEEAAPGEAAP